MMDQIMNYFNTANWTMDFQPIIKAFQDGGLFMYPILVMLVIASAIIVERLYMILWVYQAEPSKLMRSVQKLVLDNNIEEAIKLCDKKKSASIYQVFKAALMHAQKPFRDIEDHVEVAFLSVLPKLQRRVPYLFTIANVSTLLGLLGTIIGLVKTFAAVGVVEGSQKQLLLSAGISMAMNTTAFGLIVAIPCMLVYGYLYNKINNLLDEIEHYSANLLIILRTGGDYFDHFSDKEMTTTRQVPKKKVGGPPGAGKPRKSEKVKKTGERKRAA